MKPFEFYFDGRPQTDGTVIAGIKQLSGDAVDIALCLGRYASESIKQRNEPQAAIIVINAYHEFLRQNPDMAEKIMNELLFKDGARIIPSRGIIPPYKKN